jgi:hypothetical protein
MGGDRAWTAPEMTPLVDAPDEAERHAEDRRGVVDVDPAADTAPDPGEVPGLETRVEGRSRLGTTSGADRTDEGAGRQREDPAP